MEVVENKFDVQKVKHCEGHSQPENSTKINLLWSHAVIWKLWLLRDEYWGSVEKGVPQDGGQKISVDSVLEGGSWTIILEANRTC